MAQSERKELKLILKQKTCCGGAPSVVGSFNDKSMTLTEKLRTFSEVIAFNDVSKK